MFQLDDGTGRLEVKLFKSEEDEQMVHPSPAELAMLIEFCVAGLVT